MPETNNKLGTKSFKTSNSLNEVIIVLFDSECLLCNVLVNFILKRSKDIFFAPFYSNLGITILAQFGLESNSLTTVYLVEKGNLYSKSSAILRIAKRLNGLWSLTYLLIIIPAFIRDGVYDLISKHRRTWFGNYKYCAYPKPDYKGRILE